MQKQTSKKKNAIIISAIAVFAVIMTFWIGNLVSQKIKLEKELDEKKDVLIAMQEENTALEALVDEENETALMEKYARKAGYVYPAERVYINGN